MMMTEENGMHKKKTIVMMGPSLWTKGGVSSVLRMYRDHLRLEHQVKFVPTYSGDGRWKDILLFGYSVLWLLLHACFFRNEIYQLHTGVKGSWLRKSILANIAFFFKRKVIFHIHGSQFDLFFNNVEPGKRKSIIKVLCKADKVIVLSDKWKRFFCEFLPESMVEIVYNPCIVQTPRVRDHEGIVFLFMGRFGMRKGSYDLIHAFAQINVPGARLIMHGDGELKECRKLVEQLGLHENVSIDGWIEHAKIGEVYDKADVLVLPSYAEGLPMSILEALGYGMPIISTPVGGIPEAVIPEYNGWLVPPGNVDALKEAMHQAASQPKLCLEYGNNSRSIASEKFGMEATREKLLSIYQGL